MNRYYLGTFPPVYGGVTIKNLNLFKALSEQIDISKVDFSEIKRKNILELLKLIRVLINKNNVFVIGVTGKKTRRRFCKLLYYVNKTSMKKSLMFLMGGAVANDIACDASFRKYVSQFKKIYAETEGMKRLLENAGLDNVEIYPNGRFKPIENNEICKQKVKEDKFKCVFFSLINELKGVSNILETACLLSDIDFYFYGVIEPKYKDFFINKTNELPNVFYNGVFESDKNNIYNELVKYDVLLLPTQYKTEGIPGILVEAKMAGIPAIVSDVCYNAEIVNDGVDGIVLEENTVGDLKKALEFLKENPSELYKMKKLASQSASVYYIENYIDNIVNELR